MSEPKKYYYVVMKIQKLSSITVNNYPITPPKNGPQHMLPVFDTWDQAVLWAGVQDRDSIHAVETV